MEYMAERDSQGDLSQTIEEMKKEIGIDIKPTAMEMMTYMSENNAGNFNISLAETYGSIYDPFTFVNNMDPDMMADAVARQAMLQSEQGMQVLKELASSVDETDVQAAYDFIIKEINDSATLIPITYTSELLVYSDKVASYEFGDLSSLIRFGGFKLK